MNELSIPQELSVLDKSIYLARHINTAVEVLRPLVYQVYQQELWREKFSSFGEYVESPEGLNKSQGYASKLRSVEEHYIVKGNLAPEKLEGIDYECLYLAERLPGTVEEQLSMARTLTRREIKETLNEAEAHVHSGETVTIHKCCGMRIYEPSSTQA